MPESPAIEVVAVDVDARPYPAVIVEDLHCRRLDIADLGRLVRHEKFVVGTAWTVASDGALNLFVAVQRPVLCAFTLRFGAHVIPSLREVVRRGGFVLCTTTSKSASNQQLLVFLEAAGALARVLKSASLQDVPPLGACKVLVVSNDTEYAYLLPFVFRKVELATYVCGESDAVTAVAEHRPDILLVDARRGALGAASIELFARLRKQTPVPILALIDLGDQTHGLSALENGVDDVVYVSSGAPEMLGRLLLHLQRKGKLDSGVSVVLPPTLGSVEAGPLSLSILDGALWNGFKWHRLTPCQVRLMIPLMESPGVFRPFTDLVSRARDNGAPSAAALISVVISLQVVLAAQVTSCEPCRVEINESSVRLALPGDVS
jgi:DNA-binding response OmpR family regulator